MKESRAFTLVELLVVIAILSVLVSILAPSLRRARMLARRVADGSNAGQFVAACHAYASGNQSHLPLGARESSDRGADDDLVWFRHSTWVKLRDAYGMPKGVIGCNSWARVPGWADSAGEMSSSGNGTFLGWIYWGNRRDRPMDFPDGDYRTIKQLGDTGTSGTLVTCMAFYATASWNGFMPHIVDGDGPAFIPPGSTPEDFQPTAEGLNVGRVDGSARWVPWERLEMVRQNLSSNFLWYDPD